MTPCEFKEQNWSAKAPEGFAENQVATISAFGGIVRGGSLDGERQAICAWIPNAEELAALNEGSPIFVSMIGGLAPHCLFTSFEEARNVA